MCSTGRRYGCILLILCIIIHYQEIQLIQNSRDDSRFSNPLECNFFREMDLSRIDLEYVFLKSKLWDIEPGELLTILLAYHLPFQEGQSVTKNEFRKRQERLLRWYPETYQYGKTACSAALEGIRYFPVPRIYQNSKNYWVSYVNSWGYLRTYGGTRSHEGTDLMADRNISGLYPILSVTDGIVEQKGWLEKGGYRIGIRSEHGGYFYYAHLSQYAALEKGDAVKAGQLIGFMGDTGYGVSEGTRGLFAVHLHFGIYFEWKDKEYSVNPYWLLKYLEKETLCYNLSRK